MTEKPEPDDDKLPDAEADERFNRTLGNLVNTPPATQEDLKRTGAQPTSANPAKRR